MRKILVPAAIAVVAVVAAACSGGGGGGGTAGPSGSGAMSGTINGSTVNVRSAINAKVTGNGNSEQVILLSDASNLCATITSGKQPGNAKVMLFQVANINGSTVTAPTAPGTYFVHDPSSQTTDTAVASMDYFENDANCQQGGAQSGSSGTFTLSSISNGTFVGTAHVITFGGETFGVSFSADPCPALGPLLFAPNPPPCQT